MKAFVGIFVEWLTNFVKFKQSLGYKYETEAGELYRFSIFTTTFSLNKPILTKEIVQAWCAKRVHEGVRNSRRRAYPIRQFAVYLNSMGLDAYILPPDTNTCHYTFIPYTFHQCRNRADIHKQRPALPSSKFDDPMRCTSYFAHTVQLWVADLRGGQLAE